MIVLAAVGVAWLPIKAEATISYNLDFVFAGQQPGAPGSWGTVSFTTVGSNTLVTMTATGLSSGEFITFWGFDSTAPVSAIGTPTSSVSGAATGTIAECPTDPCTTAGGFKAAGDGFYDIVVSFETANNGGRLTAGESVSFTIIGATESNFSPLSNPGGGSGTYNTAIHIQGIQPGADCSAWVGNSTSTGKGGSGTGTACGAVPEPGSLALLASGLVSVGGLLGMQFRNRSRKETV